MMQRFHLIQKSHCWLIAIHLLTLSGLLVYCPCTIAKTDDDSALLEELRYLQAEKVTVASKVPTKEREAPAILTVVTEEEILNSGARDLIDILRLVPGFDFGVDVLNVVGPSIRNNWAYEGGILLLIDGLEMNERRYGTVQLGQHYPIDNIQKIEIIRGPGSIMYGGFARLGVINILTKNPNNQQGVSLVGRFGQMQRGAGHKAIHLYAGKKFSDDLQMSVSGKLSQAQRSDRNYNDAFGNSVNLANTNALEDKFLNISLQYKKLALRFLADNYAVESSDDFTQITPASTKRFDAYLVDAKYQADITKDLNFNFNLNYSQQISWAATDIIDGKKRYVDALATKRYFGKTRLDYTVNPYLQTSIGLEFSYENFDNLAGVYDNYHAPGFYQQSLPVYKNLTPYFESTLKTAWGNLIVGLRYDKHNVFESNLAPRLAITNIIDKFHYKILYSNSFRTPTVENFFLSVDHAIKPERTQAYEIELGYRFSPQLSLTTNAFYLSSKNKILYGVDDNNVDIQYNADTKINTLGVESELRWKQNWGALIVNHSYAQMLSNFSAFQPLNVLGQSVSSGATLAFPSHKISLSSHIHLDSDLSINPSLTFSTSRYAYNRDENDIHQLHKYSPEILGNVYFRYENLFVRGLELGFGVYDIFGANHQFIQPYNSGHAPLPGPSREFIFKLSYQL